MSKSWTFFDLMKREHLKVVRMVGYALTLGGSDAFLGLTAVLVARLDPKERAALAFAALRALDPDDAMLTAEAALEAGAGAPLPPLLDVVDEAAFWADRADTEELDAYGVAIFNVMSGSKQRAFLKFAGRGAA